MQKRYQVFVSSTFTDLVDERRAVMQALLELDCIPAGMELFPASSDDQWTLIQRVIDDCDYYLVIVGGRYGSIDNQGISYTEREYDYALSQGKPVLGFVHRNPEDLPARLTDRDRAAAEKLEAFRAKVQQRMCKFWANADELGGVVSRSYVQLLKTHPAEGWVKFRYAKTTDELEKVNQMHEQIRILEKEVVRLREQSPGPAAVLAHGDDPVELKYVVETVQGEQPRRITVTWNELLGLIGRRCLDVASEASIESAIEIWFRRKTKETERIRFRDLDRVKVQFYCLGLIRTEMIFQPNESWRSADTPPQPTLCWLLTEAGRQALGNLLGEKRPATAAAADPG